MEWGGKSQLRITPWPAQPVPLPLVARLPSQLDPSRTVITPVFENGIPIEQPELVELTGETYLELEQVDLDAPDSILAFVNKYGPLGGRFAYHGLRTEAEGRADDVLFYLRYWEALDGGPIWDTKREALMQLSTLPANKRVSPKTREDWQKSTTERLLHQLPPVVETLEEFRFAANLLAELKAAWMAVRRGETTMRVGDPAVFLTDFLERLMRPFSPRLGLRVDYFPPAPGVEILFGPPTEVIVEPQREPQSTPLHAICALELFNHIVDNAPYHTCANERCRRTFVHQQGRSEKGQRRSSGVLYCTPECARATAQREYRRRRRRERG